MLERIFNDTVLVYSWYRITNLFEQNVAYQHWLLQSKSYANCQSSANKERTT